MSEPRAVHLVISGRVQGVGFRWFVRHAADDFDVTGRVRNLPDGRVEVWAAADADQLTGFVERLREGPPGARVTAIAEKELSPVPSWAGFDIDH